MLARVNLNLLRNHEFVQLFRDIKGLILMHDTGKLMIEEEFRAFVTVLDELDEVFGNYNRMSKYTQQLVRIGKERNQAVSGLKGYMRVMIKHYEQDKSKAAQLLLARIESYGSSIPRLNDEAETTVIKNLVDNFEQDIRLKTALETLDLTAWVGHLKSKNDEFSEIYHQRLSDLAVKSNASLAKVRPKAYQLYKELIDRINAALMVFKTPQLKKLGRQINVLSKRYQDIPKLRRRSTSSAPRRSTSSAPGRSKTSATGHSAGEKVGSSKRPIKRMPHSRSNSEAALSDESIKPSGKKKQSKPPP